MAPRTAEASHLTVLPGKNVLLVAVSWANACRVCNINTVYNMGEQCLAAHLVVDGMLHHRSCALIAVKMAVILGCKRCVLAEQ